MSKGLNVINATAVKIQRTLKEDPTITCVVIDDDKVQDGTYVDGSTCMYGGVAT